MYLESFRHLIEIDALKRANETNLLNIQSEKNRISALDSKRILFAQEIEASKAAITAIGLSALEREVEILQQSLSRQMEQLNLVTTQKEQSSLELQIAELKDKLQTHEESYFLKLSHSEELEEKIKNHENFLSGSLLTINEIQSEVDQHVAREEKIISDRQSRIEALYLQMHPSLKSLYLELEKNFKGKKPVGFLLQKKCSECHMQVDTLMRASLEEGKSIEFCPNCNRLLIPETAKIYG